MADMTELKKTAARIRMSALEMVYRSQSGHLGGSFSAADIIAALYFYKMRVRPEEPRWPDRDRFVLSKGHAAPALYAALAMRGFFDPAECGRLRRPDSFLQGATSFLTPGVDMTSGPLGQGLSAAVGIACAAKIQKKPYRTYVIIGDGESQEGAIWEGMMEGSRFKLDNLTCFLDKNGVQMNGTTDEIMPVGDPAAKARAFGWEVREIDGNSMEEIVAVLDEERVPDKPLFVVAHTVKGKGVSFMEGDYHWHGKAPNEAEYALAMEELKGALK